MLRTENISFKVGNATLLKETTVAFAPGKFHVIMGANGAGKSTLLKLLAAQHKPSTGAIYFEEKDLRHLSKKNLAIKRAVLSQQYQIGFPINVDEIVLMGRYPYFSTSPSAKDNAICKNAMKLMNVQHLASRDYTSLSGGEAQKVQMSRVLAQIGEIENSENKVLLLDEPVSHLDVKYQHQLLAAAKSLCEKNVTVIAVLHDINLSLKFARRLLFMKSGKIIYDLQEAKELTKEIITDVFDVSSSILQLDAHPPVVIL